MQGLFIFMVWSTLILLGFAAPFVMSLAYIWVDLFRPQDVAPAIDRLLSISMITALLAIGTYLIADRRNPPRLGLLTFLLLVWAAWITLTTSWALFPEPAWQKWDWAFKTVAFTVLLPFVFRTRIQIEAAVLVIVCTIFANVMPFAIKTMLSGSGYGRQLGLVGVNTSWAGESSALATFAFATLPLIVFLQRHSLIAPPRGALRYVYLVAPFIAAIGAFGTFARAAIVACLAWAALAWWHSHRKAALTIALMAGAVIVVPLMGESWIDRMYTAAEARTEESALTRLIVWGWTIDFANSHPLGGGFVAYLANDITVMMPDGETLSVVARAFHNIFFEVLGEHGWMGLAIFCAIFTTFFVNMWRLRRSARNEPELQWLADLARALSHSALIFIAGGMFVGIAFQPLHYYLFALSVSATAFMVRVRSTQADTPPASVEQPAQAPRAVAAWRLRTQRPGPDR